MDRTLLSDVVDRNRLGHTVEITDWNGKDFQTITQWCENNCRHAWANRFVSFFLFEDVTDALLFQMTWG